MDGESTMLNKNKQRLVTGTIILALGLATVPLVGAVEAHPTKVTILGKTVSHGSTTIRIKIGEGSAARYDAVLICPDDQSCTGVDNPFTVDPGTYTYRTTNASGTDIYDLVGSRYTCTDAAHGKGWQAYEIDLVGPGSHPGCNFYSYDPNKSYP